MNQLTIGRNPKSTIVVSSQYDTVSGDHATITKDGNSFILEDHSTNGTYVNGVHVHGKSCKISPTDRITLGKLYNVDLEKVWSILSPGRETQYRPAESGTAREVLSGTPQALPNCLEKWNWGAFLLGWIWGIGNGVYWPLICLIPYVGQIASIIIIFILGANGSHYAWDKFNGTAAEFDEKQRNWSIAGIAVFGIGMVLALIGGMAVALSM